MRILTQSLITRVPRFRSRSSVAVLGWFALLAASCSAEQTVATEVDGAWSPPGRQWLVDNLSVARANCDVYQLEEDISIQGQLDEQLRGQEACEETLLSLMGARPRGSVETHEESGAFHQLALSLFGLLAMDLGPVHHVDELAGAHPNSLVGSCFQQEVEYVGDFMGVEQVGPTIFNLVTSSVVHTEVEQLDEDTPFLEGVESDVLVYAKVEHGTRTLTLNGSYFIAAPHVFSSSLLLHEAAHVYMDTHHTPCLSDLDVGPICDSDWDGAWGFGFGLIGVASTSLSEDGWFGYHGRWGTDVRPADVINAEHGRVAE